MFKEYLPRIIHISGCCILLSYSNLINAQGGYANELKQSVRIPNSPAAQAFQKYGDVQVNLYTGTPDIQVPLHTYSGRELDLPMIITYDASGIKVPQAATQVGLGWNLNFGGRISRVVNGVPDDYNSVTGPYHTYRDPMPTSSESVGEVILRYLDSSNRSFFQTKTQAKNYLRFLESVNSGQIDTQLDFFSLNVLGINDMIVFDLIESRFRTLNNPRIKVEHTYSGTSLVKWVITDENGTKYHFDERENTITEGNDYNGPDGTVDFYGLRIDYNSSWLLTKIVSANKKDEYVFSYRDFGFDVIDGVMAPAVMEVNYPDPDLNEESHPIGTGNVTRFQTTYKVLEKHYDKVYHNGNRIMYFFPKQRRDDNADSALDQIITYFPGSGNRNQIIEFEHSYFGRQGVGGGMLDVRLKLDKVHFMSGRGEYDDNYYSFSYIDPHDVPSRSSMAQDMLGYYNGKNGNVVLYPAYFDGEDTYAGADRTANFDYAKKGLLNKITYPTKGYTMFEYESHGDLFENRWVEKQVLKYGHNVAPGVGDPNDCLPCDKWRDPPNISSKVINVAEAKTYYSEVFSNYYQNEVYLLKLPNSTKLEYWERISGSEYVHDLSHLRSEDGAPVALSLDLETGYYQIMLVNAGQSTIALNIFDNIRELKPFKVGEYPGVRIKSIKNYTENYGHPIDDFAFEKLYKYTKAIDTEASSRKVIFQPNLTYSIGRQGSSHYIARVSSSNGGSLPHIAYEKVYEIKSNLTQEFIGYTEYSFKRGNNLGLKSTGIPPNVMSYNVSYGHGKVDTLRIFGESTSYESGRLLEEENSDYFQQSFFSGQSLFTIHANDIDYHYAMIYPSGSGYRIQPVRAENWCYVGSLFPNDYADGCTGLVMPSICNQPGNECYGNLEVSRLELRTNDISGVYNNLRSVTKKYYEGSITNVLTETQEISYETEKGYFLPRKVKNSNSSGGFEETSYQYPFDYTSEPYASMVIDNYLSSQVKVQSNRIKDSGSSSTVFTQKNNYASLGNTYLPISKETSKGANPLELAESYAYDVANNISQLNMVASGGTNTSYLWGYGGKYIVAKVENAIYQDLIDILGEETINNIRNQNYSDEDLRALLTPLYSLDQSMVTIYTHKPTWGVTSITDPSQTIVYYEYDFFGRLEYILDKNRNIMSGYQYNYKK